MQELRHFEGFLMDEADYNPNNELHRGEIERINASDIGKMQEEGMTRCSIGEMDSDDGDFDDGYTLEADSRAVPVSLLSRSIRRTNLGIGIALLLSVSLLALRGMQSALPIGSSSVLNGMNTHLARKEDIYSIFDEDEAVSEWEVADFGFEEYFIPGTEDEQGNLDVEYCITGFSESGKKKLKKLPKLVLPSVGSTGSTPAWIAEGAFSGMEIGEVEIPGNYTHIQFGAFKNCKIKRVILQEGILFANKFAFMDNSIEEVVFPHSFRYAAEGAFKNNQIKKLVFPEQTTSIGKEAFMNNALTEIVFQGKLKHIHDRAFAGNRLTEVEIPKSLRKWEDGIPGIYDTAFDDNPGMPNPKNPQETKVLLWTPRRNNPFELEDRGNYRIDARDWIEG